MVLGLKQPGGGMWIKTDADRREFLKALDNSDKVEVNDWEAKFIADNMQRGCFTVAQQDVIARLYRQYDHKM